VTLGDADFRKSLMKMVYRKLPKTASLPVTCHRFVPRIPLVWDGEDNLETGTQNGLRNSPNI